jgi:hypothetical protein
MSDDTAPVSQRHRVPRPAPAQTRGTGRSRRWPWVVAAAALLVFLTANLAYPPDAADVWFQVMFTSIVGVVAVVGALLTVRVERNPIGPLLLVSGCITATTIALGTWAFVMAGTGTVSTGILALAAIANDLGFLVTIVILLIFVPLIFPDGRLLSRRWRLLIGLGVSALVAVALASILTPGRLDAIAMDNPFAVPGVEPLTTALDQYANWTSIVGFGGAVAAVAIRYRRGGSVERHQLKWLIGVASVAAVAFPVAFIVPTPAIADTALLIGFAALFAMPIAIAVAILRYRLYEIDRVISRTIAWAVISGVLLGAFVVLVIGLQAALAGFTGSETLAVAMSTLGACALFQPVRARVQRAVDRRFDRARYDAQRTAHAFSERLRDDVDLDALASELRETAIGAIRPAFAGIWLADRSAGRE